MTGTTGLYATHPLSPASNKAPNRCVEKGHSRKEGASMSHTSGRSPTLWSTKSGVNGGANTVSSDFVVFRKKGLNQSLKVGTAKTLN